MINRRSSLGLYLVSPDSHYYHPVYHMNGIILLFLFSFQNLLFRTTNITTTIKTQRTGARHNGGGGRGGERREPFYDH